MRDIAGVAVRPAAVAVQRLAPEAIEVADVDARGELALLEHLSQVRDGLGKAIRLPELEPVAHLPGQRLGKRVATGVFVAGPDRLLAIEIHLPQGLHAAELTAGIAHRRQRLADQIEERVLVALVDAARPEVVQIQPAQLTLEEPRFAFRDLRLQVHRRIGTITHDVSRSLSLTRTTTHPPAACTPSLASTRAASRRLST